MSFNKIEANISCSHPYYFQSFSSFLISLCNVKPHRGRIMSNQPISRAAEEMETYGGSQMPPVAPGGVPRGFSRERSQSFDQPHLETDETFAAPHPPPPSPGRKRALPQPPSHSRLMSADSDQDLLDDTLQPQHHQKEPSITGNTSISPGEGAMSSGSPSGSPGRVLPAPPAVARASSAAPRRPFSSEVGAPIRVLPVPPTSPSSHLRRSTSADKQRVSTAEIADEASWNQFLTILSELTPERTDLDAMYGVCKRLVQHLNTKPIHGGRRKSLALRSLFRMLDMKDARLLINISRIVLMVSDASRHNIRKALQSDPHTCFQF